ncbi:MAG: addiction module protein [Verrucomicrobia bacterium]|nr:addiction module protein [Verrucomicrobiota bacterium]
MIAEDIKTMPMARKLQLMEAIWEDLRERFEQTELSPQLKSLLDQRRARVRAGTSQVLDWDAVKANIGRP